MERLHARSGLRALFWLGLAPGICAGCATASPPPSPVAVAQVDATPEVVRSRLVRAIGAMGLVPSPTSAPTDLRATAAAGAIDPSWAVCPHLWYEDPTSFFPRWQVARPSPLSAMVRVGVAPSGGMTAVRAEARFEGTYLDNFVNYTRTASCRSTGTLERRLLDAAAAG